MNRPTSLRWLAGLAALSTCCAAAPPPAFDAIAHGYVRAALQLAQHQPSLVSGWRGDPAWRPGPREPVATVRARVETLIAALDASDPGDGADGGRARYLRRQLGALDTAANRLLGGTMPFADEVEAAFGVPLAEADEGRLREARAELERRLPGTGTLGARQAAFRRSMTVPATKVRAVLDAALQACRERTRAHLPLPADEAVDLRLGVDSPWDGFARYQGRHRSTIEISGQSPLDVSRALHLACHEAYPGHHTQDLLLDAAAAAGRPELWLQPAFGVHLLTAEGAAEVGVDLAFPPRERVRLYRDVLFPLAGLPVARVDTLLAVDAAVATLETGIPAVLAAYLDSRVSRDAALETLAGSLAVMEPARLLAFAEQQRTRAVAYVLGRRLVAGWLAGQDTAAQWRGLATAVGTVQN